MIVNTSWELKFRKWAQPPGKTEEQHCENAIQAINNAIKKNNKLKNRSLKVFSQGSYRNRVNVRQDSDVDVGVLCDDSFLSIPKEPREKPLESFRQTIHISSSRMKSRKL